ncbi:hypothetical protein [Okeania sp. SIO1I7]|uniref:hypothetical protein n=1 Tax=Okeania sp. SIO1I7 TaxID=2607772 RepID=UPI0025DC2724|nr:hypothetical protein [Okeania sp. SIO1I7]
MIIEEISEVTNTDDYTIYLVNKSPNPKVFWCFLERPEVFVDNPHVFANSTTNLQVYPNQPGQNSFTIPVQYVVGAGASNNPIEEGIKIQSSVSNDANIKDEWEVDYATVPPNRGPLMNKSGEASPDKTISIQSSSFEKERNEAQGWYSSMTFGIKTSNGFIGMTWDPDPAEKEIITPKLTFYVSVGTYSSSTLANFTTVSNHSAKISLSDFDLLNNATVTLESDGTWKVTKGKSSQLSIDSINSLVQSHLYLSKAHAELVSLATLKPYYSNLLPSSSQTDVIVDFDWLYDSYQDEQAPAGTFIQGTLTVTVALTAAFSVFLLSGVSFNMSGQVGTTTFNFSYNGSASSEFIKSLFVRGAEIYLKS